MIRAKVEMGADQVRGTALLEMVIVVPLFLVLLGCIFDLGRAVNDRALLQEASKVGAREASKETTITQAAVEARARTVIREFLTAGGYDPGQYRVVAQLLDVPVGDAKIMHCVKVAVTAPAGMSIAFLLPNSLTNISEASFFRMERFPTEPAPGG